jgi:hypothetical protein
MRHERCAAILLFLASFLVTTVGAQTLDEILAKNYKAMGGLDRIESRQTVWVKGKMMMGGMELPFVAFNKRPNMFRSEATIQGQKIIEVFDGTSGWMINPMMGSSDPIDLPSEELKNLKEQADFDGYLVDWKNKGYKLELIGKEDVEGADAYHIKVTTNDTTVRHVYLDADSYLEIEQKGKYPMGGKEIEVTTSIGSYKMVDSMMVPFSTDGKVEGKTVQQALIDSIAFNVPVAD